MKKIITLFAAIAISMGSMWAANFSYSTISYSYMHTSTEWTNSAGTVQVIDWYWHPDGYDDEWVELMFIVNVSEIYNYGNVSGPAPGTYSTFYSGNSLSANAGCLSSNSNYPCNAKEYNGSGYSTWTLITGSVVIEQGANGYPYVNIDLATAKGGKVQVKCGTQLPKYAISVSANNEYGWVNSIGGYYVQGSNSDIYTATAASNGVFTGWYENGVQISTSTSYQYTNIQSAHTLQAHFSESIGGTITVNADGNGTVTGTGTYDGGANVSLTATPASGYTFVMWQKDGEPTSLTQNPTIQCSGDATYTAVFKRIYTITANTNDGSKGSASISPTGTHYDGQTITLTATPSGMLNSFVKWQKNGVDIAGGAILNTTVDGDATYTAVFEGQTAIEIYDEEGVFEMGTSHTGYFTIRGDNENYHAELNFNATIQKGSHSYTYAQLDNSTEWSWIKPNGGSKLAITDLSITIDYYGLDYRAAALEALVSCEDGKLYYVTIFTNTGTECGGFIESNTMGFRDDGYGGWDLGSSPGISPVVFSAAPEVSIENGDEIFGSGVLMKWSKYRGDPYYETTNAALLFMVENPYDGVPSGRYPINGTKKPGTVFIGGMDANQFYSSYAEYNYGGMFERRYSNWVYRYGYVDVVNKGDGTYYVQCYGMSDGGGNLYFNAGTAPVVASHTVTFQNYDGTSLQSGQVNQGATPSYTGSTPTKPSTASTVYTFLGWNDGANSYDKDATLPAVGSSDVTYTATFSESARTYAIRFENEDHSELHTYQVAYNTLPVYDGATPAKASTSTKSYTFAGWTPEVANVTGNATYTATFNETDRLFTIHITTPENGTLVVKDNNGHTLADGETVTNGTILTAYATPAAGYKFGEWTSGAESVVVDGTQDEITFSVTFAALATYTLTLDYNDNGKIVVTGDGNTYESKEDEDTEITVYEGKEYTCTLVPEDNENGWGFWTDEYYSYTVNSNQTIKITPTEDIKLYSIFGLKRVELNGKLGAQYYEDNYNDKWVHELVYLRTFKAKDWQAMWMPFPIDIEYQGLDGILYTLSKSEIQEQANGIIDVALSFHRLDVGAHLAAGNLCLFYSKQAVTDFVFKDIVFPAAEIPAAENMAPKNTSVGTGNAKVNFIGQTTYSNIGGVGEEALQKSYRYLKDNVLYYPKLNSGVKMQAYNGYWQIDNYNYWYAGGPSSAPRLRIIVDGEEITEAGMEDEVEVTKYINEEGILIIERNGVKYTATGAIIQ